MKSIVSNINMERVALMPEDKKNPFVKAVLEWAIHTKYHRRMYYLVPATDLLPELYQYFQVDDFNDLLVSQTERLDYVQSVEFKSLEEVNVYMKESKLSIVYEADLDTFKKLLDPRVKQVGDITFIFVSGIPLNDKMRHLIEENARAHENRVVSDVNLAKLPKDVFGYMVMRGKIKGADLIKLCSANKATRIKCDENLMRNVLRQEFGIEDYNHEYSESAYDVYVLLHLVKERRLFLVLNNNTYRYICQLYFYDKNREERKRNPAYLGQLLYPDEMTTLVLNAVTFFHSENSKKLSRGVISREEHQRINSQNMHNLWLENREEIISEPRLTRRAQEVLETLDINQFFDEKLQELRDKSKGKTKAEIIEMMQTAFDDYFHLTKKIDDEKLETYWALHELVIRGIVDLSTSMRAFSDYLREK